MDETNGSPDHTPPSPQRLPVAVRRDHHRNEPELRAAVARWLRARGVALAERVICVAGEPDIVSAGRDLIVECKHRLSRKALFQAVGQVQLYQQALNPQARMMIVGTCTPDALVLVPLLAKLNIEVVCWEDQDGEAHPGRAAISLAGEADTPHGVATNTITTSPEGSAPTGSPVDAYRVGAKTIAPRPASTFPPSPSSFLVWRVAQLAQARGLDNTSQLASRSGLSRQGLYAIWNGTAAQVSLTVLGRLAHILDAEPGDWFRLGLWVGDQGMDVGTRPAPDAQSLHWNVAAEATARGVDLSQLGFQAAVHPTSMRPIWMGEQQAVTLMVLGRIAQALNTPERPFRIGDLFSWKTEGE